MLPFYPDKPIQSSDEVLPHLAFGDWLAQFKYDGWRTFIETGVGYSTFTSRAGRPIPVSSMVAGEMHERLGHLPPGTLLDAEWMERRAGNVERFWIFDVLRIGQVDWRPWVTQDRFEKLFSAWDESRQMVPEDLIVPHCKSNYSNFYALSKEDPATEGIVLKRIGARYIGSTRECALNPNWLKVKWRDGSGGQTRT
jgi:ATP-dependent DNA ligase